MITRRATLVHGVGVTGLGRPCAKRRAISKSPRPLHRSGRARRPDRCHGARHFAWPEPQVRPARDHRQSGRCRRQYRRGAGREVAGGRLHASDRLDRLRRQSEPFPRSRLRSVQGFPADHRVGLVAQRHPGPPLFGHHLDRRARRQSQGCQGQARRHQSGPGFHAAPDGRAVAAQGRHHGRKHCLQRRGAGHPGIAGATPRRSASPHCRRPIPI